MCGKVESASGCIESGELIRALWLSVWELNVQVDKRRTNTESPKVEVEHFWHVVYVDDG
jgi:hypothetical protein